jgi:hypothetical protein
MVKMAKHNVLTYQYGEHKIELRNSTGNFELLINGEVQDSTKDGKIKFQLSGDTFLTGKLPSGEEVNALKMEKLVTKEKVLLFVGQQLFPQENNGE